MLTLTFYPHPHPNQVKQRESLTGTLSEEDYAKMEKKVIVSSE